MFSKFLFCILFVSVLTVSSVKSDEGFDCKSPANTKCKALAGYVSPNATTLSTIATLFGVTDFNSLLEVNKLPKDTPETKSVASKETVKIPFNCSCRNGNGISDGGPIYKVKAGDGLDHIARDLFSLLITYEDIQEFNNIPNANLIEIGQVLKIPLPCSCDNVDSKPVIHYAHKVAPKQTLAMIGKEFGVSEKILLTLNDLDDAKDLKAESVLDVPLEVCTSMATNTSPDYSMLVSNGTKCEAPGGSPTSPSGTSPSGTAPSGTAPSGPSRSGSPSMSLQGWNILWLTMSFGLLLCSSLLS